MHLHLARAASLLAYSASCAFLHSLLHQHYSATCVSWLSVLSLEKSPYCAFVKGGIKALQFAPVALLAAGGVPRYLLDADNPRNHPPHRA
jgi:hypothetical protein